MHSKSSMINSSLHLHPVFLEHSNQSVVACYFVFLFYIPRRLSFNTFWFGRFPR